MRAYLAEKRGRAWQEVYLPLVWRAGDGAQVDFSKVTVEVAGKQQKAWLFVLHLMYSGRDFAWLYERCNQVAFPDGHVRAFEHLGGVARELSARFQALCSHYLFKPCFAHPGEEHDKGGVEARGKNPLVKTGLQLNRRLLPIAVVASVSYSCHIVPAPVRVVPARRSFGARAYLTSADSEHARTNVAH